MDPKQITTNVVSSMANINIKTEPGQSCVTPSTSAISRLQSFKLPRDLTLGGSVKPTKSSNRVYTPNLNVQRNKRRGEGGSTSSNSSISQNKRSARGPRGGRGVREGRSRGAKANTNLIQSAGVFSEGMAGPSKRNTGSWGGGQSSDRESHMPLEKHKLNLSRDYDKDEEEKKLQSLLRSDFIDDDDDDEEYDTRKLPVVLPFNKESNIFKKNVRKIKKNVISDDDDDDQGDKKDKKPIILESGEIVMPKNIKKLEVVPPTEPKRFKVPETISEAIEEQSNGYIFVRLPTKLPGLESTSGNINNPSMRDDSSAKPSKCQTLNTVKEGFLGEIQIHESGKAYLVVGDTRLLVDLASLPSFRQDVVAAKLDESNNELVNLGQVTSSLMCTPDWDSMLKSLKRQ